MKLLPTNLGKELNYVGYSLRDMNSKSSQFFPSGGVHNSPLVAVMLVAIRTPPLGISFINASSEPGRIICITTARTPIGVLTLSPTRTVSPE